MNGFYLYKDVRILGAWKETVDKLDARMTKIEKKFENPHFLSDLAKVMLDTVDKRQEQARANQSSENPLSR